MPRQNALVSFFDAAEFERVVVPACAASCSDTILSARLRRATLCLLVAAYGSTTQPCPSQFVPILPKKEQGSSLASPRPTCRQLRRTPQAERTSWLGVRLRVWIKKAGHSQAHEAKTSSCQFVKIRGYFPLWQNPISLKILRKSTTNLTKRAVFLQDIH